MTLSIDDADFWRRSGYSGGENNDCVEVARTRDALRDSKHPGPRLLADVPALVAALRHGLLSR